MEKFANSATSTLVNILSQSDTTFAVHSATGFPNSGNFRCLIDSELVLVTGVSGTTFTCTRSIESTTAATHAANASVIAVMTAGGLATAIAEGGGEFLQVLTDDQTPTLGGNLDLNGHTIAGATATEIGYLSGVTSAIQSQLDSKANTANLADVAESGAYSDLSGTPSLAAVATAGTYSSLTGKPTLGTAAALDVGTTANKVVQLNGSAALPAIDGSNLTGVIHHVTDEITGAATSIVSSNLTASRVVVSDSSGKVAASSVTSTTLGYLDATSSIQTQINAKAATSSLATVATSGAYSDLSGTPSLATVATSGAYSDLSGTPTAITGAATSIVSSNLTASKVLVSDGSGKVAASSVTSTTLGYLDATSSIQTQLNALQPTITGGATSITSSNLTASRALVSDGSGKVAVSSVTSTTLGYLDATSSVQTQIDGKQKKETITNDTDGSTITFDLSASSIHFVTLGGNRTFALSNPTTGQRFMVRPLQDSSGSRTITWWSGISWAGGTPPTPTATADKADLFGFLCTGTNTYDGFIMGQNI
jgi:hypothetical protein